MALVRGRKLACYAEGMSDRYQLGGLGDDQLLAAVCREYPEAFARVANGELQLSVLCALRPHLNAEKASGLFAVCSRKSYEQVEVLLASRFPKPDVRDLVRRLPALAVGTPHMR